MQQQRKGNSKRRYDSSSDRQTDILAGIHHIYEEGNTKFAANLFCSKRYTNTKQVKQRIIITCISVLGWLVADLNALRFYVIHILKTKI